MKIFMLDFLQTHLQNRIILNQRNQGIYFKRTLFNLNSLLGAAAMTIIFLVIEIIILFVGITLFYDKNNLFRTLKIDLIIKLDF